MSHQSRQSRKDTGLSKANLDKLISAIQSRTNDSRGDQHNNHSRASSANRSRNRRSSSETRPTTFTNSNLKKVHRDRRDSEASTSKKQPKQSTPQKPGGVRSHLKSYQQEISDNFTLCDLDLDGFSSGCLPSHSGAKLHGVKSHKPTGTNLARSYDPVNLFNGIAQNAIVSFVNSDCAPLTVHSYNVEKAKSNLLQGTDWREQDCSPPPFIFEAAYNSRVTLNKKQFVARGKAFIPENFWYELLLAVNATRFDRVPASVSACAYPECLSDFASHSHTFKQVVNGHHFIGLTYYKSVDKDCYDNFATTDPDSFKTYLTAYANGRRKHQAQVPKQ